MEINRDRSNFGLYVHQTPYVLKVLKKFGMFDCKPVSMHLENQFILSKEQSPVNDEEREVVLHF